MRLVLQRVRSARVTVSGRVTGEIGPGLLILLGIAENDTSADVAKLTTKVARLRIFSDENGHLNRSLLDSGGQALVVSQFTLLATTRRGTRPSFTAAASPVDAIPLYQQFITDLATLLGCPVATGEFGAEMQVTLTNDGPVTLVLDSRQRE